MNDLESKIKLFVFIFVLITTILFLNILLALLYLYNSDMALQYLGSDNFSSIEKIIQLTFQIPFYWTFGLLVSLLIMPVLFTLAGLVIVFILCVNKITNATNRIYLFTFFTFTINIITLTMYLGSMSI